MIHQKRRQELLSRLSDNAVVIVSSNSEQKRNSDVNYPFRPDSSFWYLTGFTEPDAIAVFSKKNYSIFLRPKDKTKEIWNGKRLGVKSAPKVLLADNAYSIDEFLKKIGILERANILSKKMTFKEKANMFYRLKRLLDYREMGGLFKVLFAQKKGRKFSLGF